MIAVAGAMLALIIDLMDGQFSKSVGTVGLFVGLIGLLAVRTTGRASYNYLAIAGFLLFTASMVYRMFVHQGWIQS